VGYRLRAVSVKQFCREYTEEQRLATLPQPVDVRVRTVLVPRIAKRVLEAQMPELCEHVARGHTIASALGQLGLIRCGLPGDDWFIDRAYNRPDRQLDAAVRLRRHRYGITWTHGPTIVAQVPDGHRLVAGPYGKLFVRPQRLGDRCKRGHSYEQTGYYLNPNGYRDCKACHNARPGGQPKVSPEAP
jgi:hypothetical protein